MASNPKEFLARLLGEVKYSEKQLDKVRERLAPQEARIKQALKLGNRELAKRYAIEFEELRLEVQRGEERVAAAKRQFEAGKQKASQLGKATGAAHVAQSMNAIAASFDKLGAADDMLRDLEQEAALSEAKLDLAMGDDPGLGVELPPPPAQSPEDILKEFES